MILTIKRPHNIDLKHKDNEYLMKFLRQGNNVKRCALNFFKKNPNSSLSECEKYIKSLNNTNDNNMNSIVDSESLQLDKITKEQFKDVLIYMKDHIGTIVPKGTRYIIHDISEMTGGSNKQTSVPMIILPNYMNTVYT